MSNTKKYFRLIPLLAICIILSGCFYSTGIKKQAAGSKYGTHMDCTFGYFDGEEGKKIALEQGDKITIQYDISAEQGELELLLMTEDSVLFSETNGSGSEMLDIVEGGKYKIVIYATEAEGSYDVTWEVQ